MGVLPIAVSSSATIVGVDFPGAMGSNSAIDTLIKL
jgi:hypothetical protein